MRQKLYGMNYNNRCVDAFLVFRVDNIILVINTNIYDQWYNMDEHSFTEYIDDRYVVSIKCNQSYNIRIQVIKFNYIYFSHIHAYNTIIIIITLVPAEAAYNVCLRIV